MVDKGGAGLFWGKESGMTSLWGRGDEGSYVLLPKSLGSNSPGSS